MLDFLLPCSLPPSHCFHHCLLVEPLPYGTCHSYLRKSDGFCGNPSQISVKVCAVFCRSSVASPLNRLLGSTESCFRISEIVFWTPVDSYYGSPLNDLSQVVESAKSSSIAVQSPLNVLRQPFSGTFSRYVWRFHGYPAMFPWIPSNVSADNLR